MNIKIIDYVGDRATDMEQGDKIYELIVSGFTKNEIVTIDFSGMKTILTIFLNNAIGTLYKDYTSDFLNKNLKVSNMDEDDLFILKCVTKRAKDFYSNQKEITGVLDEIFLQ